MYRYGLLVLGLLAGYGLLPGRVALAQGPWTASLFVDPFPSPYSSDWETNPNVSSLTIINPAGVERDVRLVYQVANSAGRILASGRSDPLPIPPGAPTVFTSYIDIAGSSQRDGEIQRQMERTGRIPEGTYQACVTMADGNGFVLGESCATFTIVYPDPPLLLAPGDGEAVSTAAPFFQWTPIQVPPAFQVRYALQVAELLPNQTPEEALHSTIVHYQGPDIDITNFQYPIDGQPFEPGKRYVWRVTAVDQNGFPPATNGGGSEIRTFRFDNGTGVAGGARTQLRLSLANDFDDEPEETAAAAGDESESRDIKELCSLWNDPPESVTISSASPLGLKKFAGAPAVLFRDSAAGRWWISTQKAGSRRNVLVGGDCKGTKTRVRWIASKDSTLQANINKMVTVVPAGIPGVTPMVDSLPFGMVVLATGKDKVEVPAEFEEGQAFLGSRTLDVAPGISFYTVLSLVDWGAWWVFQAMGYGEKEIELKGFLGWNAAMNIGGAIGDQPGVDLSVERKFLVLRAELPRRAPVLFLSGLVESMGLAIEISVGDSTGRAFSDPMFKKGGGGYSLDLVGKVIHNIKINDSVSLEGYVGLDLARESKMPLPKEMMLRWDWLSEKLGQKAAKPEVGLDLTIGYAIKTRLGLGKTPLHLDGVSVDSKISLKEKKQTFAVSGTLGVGVVNELGKLGFSVQRKVAAPGDTVALKTQLAAAKTKRDNALAAAGGTVDCADQIDLKDRDYCDAKRDVTRLDDALMAARTPAKAKYEWRARFSVGHMPFGGLLDLLRSSP